MLITSRSNPAVREIRALRQRKERERTGLFFVEGIRIVAEAIELQAPIERLVCAPDLLTSSFARELVRRAVQAGIPVLDVSAEVFHSLAGKEHPQGIGAVVRQRWQRLQEVRPEEGLCWVALQEVADPGNLGTILRTADAVGAAGIILVGPGVDPYDPTTVRASMGAIFSERLVRTDSEPFIRWRRERGVHLIGASDAAAQDYLAIEYRRPLILWMGSERQGLTPEQMAACDVLARIPMMGRSDSLNLAVATGVMLYAIFNQHRVIPAPPVPD